MTITALLLVLTAAFCHATWNFYVKRIGGGAELIWLISLLSVVFYLPWVVYLFWDGLPGFGLYEIGCLIISGTIHTIYLALLQRGYRHGDLSLVYPLARSTGPVISIILAVLFLGEVITAQIVAGSAIILMGIFFLTGGFRKREGDIRTSVIYGLIVGMCIGTYTAWDAYVVSVVMVSPVLLEIGSNIFRSIFLTPVAIRRKAQVTAHWRDHRTGVILIGLLSPMAYILFLYAITFTPVTLLAPIREISVLISVLMGSILLGEGNLKRRLLWSTVIIGGVGVLATA